MKKTKKQIEKVEALILEIKRANNSKEGTPNFKIKFRVFEDWEDYEGTTPNNSKIAYLISDRLEGKTVILSYYLTPKNNIKIVDMKEVKKCL